MPPAFNLSQDQTLQFNHCKVLTRLTLLRYVVRALHVLLETSARKRTGPGTPSAHTYRLYIVKERFTGPPQSGCKTASDSRISGRCLDFQEILVAGIGFEPMTFGL
jgi:hypothetical protein